MTPDEVPEGKVLVDAEDVRLLSQWPGTDGWSPIAKHRPHIAGAVLRLIAALPVPEWEPSDELVERYCTAKHWNVANHVRREVALDDLKAFHAAGLLRDDL